MPAQQRQQLPPQRARVRLQGDVHEVTLGILRVAIPHTRVFVQRPHLVLERLEALRRPCAEPDPPLLVALHQRHGGGELEALQLLPRHVDGDRLGGLAGRHDRRVDPVDHRQQRPGVGTERLEHHRHRPGHHVHRQFRRCPQLPVHGVEPPLEVRAPRAPRTAVSAAASPAGPRTRRTPAPPPPRCHRPARSPTPAGTSPRVASATAPGTQRSRWRTRSSRVTPAMDMLPLYWKR